MGSKGVASYNDPVGKKPTKAAARTPFVQGFRDQWASALNSIDPASGLPLRHCIGVYAFYDYDQEPIYVGQTWETFADRIGRHLTGQRSDVVANRLLDPFEVSEVELWPAQDLLGRADKQDRINEMEYTAYVQLIRSSRYRSILNEKMPPASPLVDLPQSQRFDLIPPDMRPEREHPDVRIARRAENLSRLAAVSHERDVSPGLRRAIVIQAVKLADLAAGRLAWIEGRPGPSKDAIDLHELIGNVMAEFADNPGDGIDLSDVVPTGVGEEEEGTTA